MNSTICWKCELEFTYSGEKYRDVNCPHCGAPNSIYDSSKYEPTPPEPERITDLLTPQNEEEKMKPKKRTVEFEKVAIAEMITGVISEVMYDQEHSFKGFQGKEDTIQPAVRFKFTLEGYEHPHYSRWYKFSYAEKSNLYKIFLTKLVENAKPDLDFDLDNLKGMKVKTIWAENGDFQNLESIFPAEGKVKATDISAPPEEVIADEPSEDLGDEV